MSELIEKNYIKAVSGLKEVWLLPPKSNKWYEYITSLPVNEQLTYMIIVLNNQVFNGGFHQYFTNGYGQFALKTVNHLKLIGANEKADILLKAYTIVNYKNVNEQEFRIALLNKLIEKLFISDDLFSPLDKIDDEYDNSNENIEQLLNEYLKSNEQKDALK